MDSTLPTKPWDQVKDVAPGSTATSTQDSDAVDAKIADAMATVTDTGTIISYLVNVVVKPKNGYRQGPGADAYDVRERLKSRIEDFASLTSSDAARSRLIIVFQDDLKHTLDAINDYIDAVTRAQSLGGWDGPAQDLIQESFAAYRNGAKPDRADLDMVEKTDAFRKAQPVLARIVDSRNEDSTTAYRLGVFFPIENSRFLTSVTSGANGDKIGLHRGDLLVSVNDQPVTTYYDFLDKLKDNRGKRVKVTVMRDGKSKSWDADVPN